MSLLTYWNEAAEKFGFLENPRPLASGEPVNSSGQHHLAVTPG